MDGTDVKWVTVGKGGIEYGGGGWNGGHYGGGGKFISGG